MTNEEDLKKELNDLKAELRQRNYQTVKKKSFFADGFSIDETRASALIIAMLTILAMAILQMYFKQDLTDNVASVLKFALTSVAGASSSFAIADAIKKNNNNL